jgi:hypothetical protein
VLQLAVLQKCCVVWSGAVEGDVVVVSGGEIRLNPNSFFLEGKFGLARELGRNENKNYGHMTTHALVPSAGREKSMLVAQNTGQSQETRN